jgi:hypothetical protein
MKKSSNNPESFFSPFGWMRFGRGAKQGSIIPALVSFEGIVSTARDPARDHDIIAIKRGFITS